MLQREIPGVFVDKSVDECPHCGLTYDDLRTGLTYADVYRLLWVESEDSADWNYKRRGSVLRLWRKLKLAMWHNHLVDCEVEAVYGEVRHGS